MNIFRIAGVCERDLDLLLMEELHASPDFVTWFLSQGFGELAPRGKLQWIRRSATDTTGESDIEFALMDQQGSLTRVLVENKVSAGMQPRQAARYRERGDGYVLRGECSRYAILLVAPDAYFGGSEQLKGFSAKVTYEQLVEWFEDDAQMGARRDYKITLLQSAIERATLGYQLVEDAAATAFWGFYWSLAFSHAPQLEMRQPEAKPSGSTFAHFRPTSLPRGIDIVHKWGHACVDLHVRGYGDRLNEIRTIFGPVLMEGMTVVRANSSAAIRLIVPKLDPAADFDHQREKVAQGLSAARVLHDWFITHRALWHAKSELPS